MKNLLTFIVAPILFSILLIRCEPTECINCCDGCGPNNNNGQCWPYEMHCFNYDQSAFGCLYEGDAFPVQGGSIMCGILVGQPWEYTNDQGLKKHAMSVRIYEPQPRFIDSTTYVVDNWVPRLITVDEVGYTAGNTIGARYSAGKIILIQYYYWNDLFGAYVAHNVY